MQWENIFNESDCDIMARCAQRVTNIFNRFDIEQCNEETIANRYTLWILGVYICHEKSISPIKLTYTSQ